LPILIFPNHRVWPFKWEGAHAHAHREGLGRNPTTNTGTTVPLDMSQGERETRIASHVVAAVRVAEIELMDGKEIAAGVRIVIPRTKSKALCLRGYFV
jgi:hypothetical protein